MAPTVVASMGHLDREPDGSFDLSTAGLVHGDMIVGFAMTVGNAFLGDSLTDYLGFQIGFLNGADSLKSGPGAGRALEITSWPTISSVTDLSLWATSCLYNSAGSTTLSPSFAVLPITLGIEDVLINIVIVRDANASYQAISEAFDNPAAWDGTNVIEYEGAFGAETGPSADGVWLEAPGYLMYADPDAEFGWVPYDHIDLSGPHLEPAPGSVVPPVSLFLGCDMPVAETGTGLTQPTGWWELDNSGGTLCIFGSSIHVQCYFDEDYDPEYSEPTDPATTQVPELHIPHKDYAFDSIPNSGALTPYSQHQYFTNLKTIESWADSLRCSGTSSGEGGTVTFTPTNGKWKERQLVIPHKEQFSSRKVRENYLAIERWANAICPTLHIPHKDWVLMGSPSQEQVNLLTIERWAREIGRCCQEQTTGGG